MQHIMTLRKFGNKTQLKCIPTNFMYLLHIKNKMTKTCLLYGFVKSIENLMKLSDI